LKQEETMQVQETLIVWAYEIPYLVKVTRVESATMYIIDRADTDFNGTYADATRTWQFPTEVVEEMGGDQAQLQALLNALAPTTFADPARMALTAA
jgi:hypothetical protein